MNKTRRCKAKITGELLLARRRLDEERSKSEALSRELRKAQKQLEEERKRRTAAAEQQQQSKAEAQKPLLKGFLKRLFNKLLKKRLNGFSRL